MAPHFTEMMMNLIDNFLELFRKKDFYYSEDLEFIDYAYFKEFEEDNILDITKFIIENSIEAKNIAERKNRLKKENAIECDSLDSLLLEIRKTVEANKRISEENNNDFTYFIDLSYRNSETLWICNSVNINSSEVILYPIIFIRKWNGKYYCWNTGLQIGTID
jgi:hypothetical protein